VSLDPRAEGAPGDVWVVLPAYNEEANLGDLLTAIAEAMVEAGQEYHVVVVDDGSKDGTLRVARDFELRLPLIIVQHENNAGLGAALRDGLMRAAALATPADVLFTMDADRSHPPRLIPRMMEEVRAGCDVVIASRFRAGSEVHGVPALRRFLSSGGSLLLRLLFPTPGVRDFTCGYRAYRYRAYRASLLQEVLRSEGTRLFEQTGFTSTLDILLQLRRRRPRFGEVPLVLRYDLKQGASKMQVARTVRATLKLLLRRRFSG
jgi:dolichol-phosphate mannosyltransferase